MRNWINLFEQGLVNMPRGGTRTAIRTNDRFLQNPQFIQWFAGSKVCDHDGNPIVCFHGTFFEFTQFRHEDKGWGGAGSGFNRLGFWFDTDPGVPNWLAGYEEDAEPSNGIVYPCFLSIKKPFALDSEWLWDEDRNRILELKHKLDAQSEVYYSPRDDLGNKRFPDGKPFDEQAYLKLRKEYDAAVKSTYTDRDDGFYRLMNALPKGIKSSTAEVAEFQAQLIAEGYDGIWIGDTIADFSSRDYKVSDWWLAFHPNQIKSIYASSFTDSGHIHESND